MTARPGHESHTVSVDAWAQQWYPTRQGLRRSTSVRNMSLYSNHIKPALGHLDLQEVTKLHVQAFVDDLTCKPSAKPAKDGSARLLAATTVREVYQELDKCLAAARQAGHLRHNPCQGITLPRIERQDMHLLDEAEVIALADAIGDRYAALVYVLSYGGLRIGEAAALVPSDFDGKSLSITKTAAEVQGKLATSVLERGAGRRVVPLPDSAAVHLVRHVETYPGAYIFTGRDGGQIRSNVFRARQFTEARAEIGRPELRIHDLRHTAVSLWIAQGVDLARIGELAGHASSAFTLNRYGHLFTG